MTHTTESGRPARRGRRGIHAAALAGALVLGIIGSAGALEGSTPTAQRVGTSSATATSTAGLAHAPRTPAVPSVVGRTKSKATATLKARGYVVRTKTKTVSRGASGVVLSQNPRARTKLARGGKVTLTISKRPSSKASNTSKNCTPGYSPCLPPASDYDCAGGSGNGPKYVYGVVTVTGSDPYDLDRDGDGYGCE